MKIRAKGFTLIELVVVIIVLGILAVIAIPKFINLSQDAHDATAKTAFSSFKTGVSLYHSCWLASGNSGYVKDLSCYGEGDIDSSATGYPLGTDTATSENGTKLHGSYCKQVWQGLLDEEFTLAMHTTDGAQDPFVKGNDILYWYSGGNISDPDTYCYYNYIADDHQKGSENWQLKYFPGTGETSVGKGALSFPQP
ncbi:PilD processed protein [Shewanella sairae]|uniref:PilD processed protein n=1 Tax=Shewanella sairae TaxID=190310 RepID=A0ABQ4PPU5_9GAMM|nr:prepilin-type N-terminal cleavage/methylation domain-containing protein [Shewanella sairae]MCL1130063.1 prepilin-type N-terminal cleavage/methylation domain-containing protein [Shewanella sairae]GIU50906.1 PilD processed protein [Shewanella sairae]